MSTLIKDIPVELDAAAAWSRVRDIGNIDDLLDFVEEVRVDDDVRVLQLPEDQHLTERIITVDDERMRLVYAILESPFDFTHHSSSMQVVPDGDGSRIVWTSDIAPAVTAEAFDTVLDNAAASITRALSRSNA